MTSSPNFSSVTNRTVHKLDQNGFIRDWLISEAWKAPANDLRKLLESDGNPFGKNGRWVLTNGPDIAPLKARIFQNLPFSKHQELPEVVEGGVINWNAPGGKTRDSSHWRRIHTGHDGYADWSHFSYTPEYRHSLMATLLEIDQPEYRIFEIESQGPVQVWLNGEIVLSTSDFGYMQPITSQIRILLPSGISTLIISQWQISLREVRHAVRVRVHGLPLRVVIPSKGADEYESEIAEQALEEVSITHWAREDEFVHFRGPADLKLRVSEEKSSNQGLPISLKNGKAKVSVKEIRDVARRAKVGNKGSIDGDVTATMLDTGEVFLEVKVDSPRTPVVRVLRSAQIPPRVRTSVKKIEKVRWRNEV